MFYIPATAKVKVDATKTVRLCKDSINKVAIFSTLYNLWCLLIELSRLSALSYIELFQGNNHQKGESIKMIFSSLFFVFLVLISLPFCILLPFTFFYHNVLLRMTQKISESCKISEEYLANTTGMSLIEAVEKIQEGEDITEDEQSLADYLKTMVSELAEAASKTLAANFKQTVLELAKNPEVSEAISTPILKATQDLMEKLQGIVERARWGLRGDIEEIGNAFIERTADKVKEISRDLMTKLDEDIRAALDAESNQDDDAKKTPNIIDNLFKLWQKNVNTSLDTFKQTVLELAKNPEVSEAISTPILKATQDLMEKLQGIVERAREQLIKDAGDFAEEVTEQVGEKVREIADGTTENIGNIVRGFNQGFDRTVDRAIGRLNGITVTPNNSGGFLGPIGLLGGATIKFPDK